MFSKRSFQPDEINRFTIEKEKLELTQVLLDLTQSNPTTTLPKEAYKPCELAKALSLNIEEHYEPLPFGLLSARNAITQNLGAKGINFSPEQIMLTSGTSEAYSFLLKLLCDPGDEILVAAPGYPLFEYLAAYEGVGVRRYPLVYAGEWYIDFIHLKAALTPKTKAILVVTPNHPTGHVIKPDELSELQSFNLPILCDEVFADYNYSGRHQKKDEDPFVGVGSWASFSALHAEAKGLLFSLSGLSKSCGLPQLKLAWTCIHGDPNLVSAAIKKLTLLADMFLSPTIPIQHALPQLLELGTHTRRYIQKRIQINMCILQKNITRPFNLHITRRSPISLLHFEAGWHVVLRLPQILSEEEWVLSLLRDEGTLVYPGSFFDFAFEPFIILSLLTKPSTFTRGVEKIVAHVQKKLSETLK